MRVAVVGAGVIGLTSALVLSGDHDVEVIAEHELLQTTSAVATAIWHLYLVDPTEERVLTWGSISLERFLRLAVGEPESGVSIVRGIELYRRQVPTTPPWAAIVPHFRLLDDREVARFPGVAGGYEVEAPLADMTQYLPWLQARCESGGVHIRRGRFLRLEDVPERFDVVVNCTGLGARELVSDRTLEPVRGQYLVLGRRSSEPMDYVGDDQNPGGMAYMIPRQSDVCVGGTEEYGAEELRFDQDVEEMLRRAGECAPILRTYSEADVIARVVGLRPFRQTGPRVERCALGDGRMVIHNYGHGGSGFTLSWGCAEAVAALIEAPQA